MARICVQSIQTHSPPISRQIAVSASLLGRTLVKTDVYSSSRPSKPIACSSPASPEAPLYRNTSALSRVGANALASHHLVGGFSPSVLSLGGMDRRAHITTGKAAVGSEAGIGSGSKKQDREILVQHLLLKEDQMQLLIELQRQVTQEGLDLSDLAEDHSLCPSKSEGGMLGWLKVGQTDPAFEEVAFNAPLNKLVRAKTKHGLHLLQVLSERTPMFLKQLDVREFHERMQNPNFLEESQLVDVREPHEISTAAVKGFEAFPLSQFGQWAPNITENLDPEKDTYVMCHHGMRSLQMANWLKSQGFRRLYNIEGGIHAYAKQVDSSIPTY